MKNDGGPAFPPFLDPMCSLNNGMSLRAWFAGQALQGILANPTVVYRGQVEEIARDCCTFADALIKEMENE